MEKHYIDKRVIQMEKEGVEFKCNSHIGSDINVEDIIKNYDAVVLARLRRTKRLKYSGRNLDGIYFAMDF